MMSPPTLPSSMAPLLVRTAFDDDAGWTALLDGVATPSEGDGFLAAAEVVDVPAYRDLTPERLRTLLPAGWVDPGPLAVDVGIARGPWAPTSPSRPPTSR